MQQRKETTQEADKAKLTRQQVLIPGSATLVSRSLVSFSYPPGIGFTIVFPGYNVLKQFSSGDPGKKGKKHLLQLWKSSPARAQHCHLGACRLASDSIGFGHLLCSLHSFWGCRSVQV